MTWPEPTRADYERFCLIEGWAPIRDAKGRTGTHHVTDEPTPHDGQVLKVGQEAFWACVRDGRRPDHGVPSVPPEALPADLVHLLLTRVGLTEDDVRALTRAEAIARLQAYWTQGS
ncbi:MAG TPA: cytotoxic translational repressor of toxin-antitoxin stability system [Trebonia sp.]|nr:cytotoxic translational repressor of toxin-antitoxin stability system [Trebonia sp.]